MSGGLTHKGRLGLFFPQRSQRQPDIVPLKQSENRKVKKIQRGGQKGGIDKMKRRRQTKTQKQTDTKSQLSREFFKHAKPNERRLP